nr:MAG TPA: hypothetical protein [Caudoviricetes sp.]
MAKPTPTKEEQGFVYQLGQDVAKLGFEIDSLKNKTVKAIRIVVPAKPEKYQQYGLKAVINLPPECQHAICIKSKNGKIDLIETEETLSVYAEDNTSEFYLAPIYRLEAETINAAFDQEQMAQIESDIHEREEREERERKEREEREELKNREELIYKYLAKWLTDNWLQSVREKSYDKYLDNYGAKTQVNQNGLQALLDKPFERDAYGSDGVINPDAYADAKTAMLNELERIKKGEVDLNATKDFEIVKYDYKNIL